MTPANDTLADSIRRRAFRSRNVRSARKLFALAEEAGSVRFATQPGAGRP